MPLKGHAIKLITGTRLFLQLYHKHTFYKQGNNYDEDEHTLKLSEGKYLFTGKIIAAKLLASGHLSLFKIKKGAIITITPASIFLFINY